MKKNLFTLLFMAVALFSAATLVSCGNDDEVVNHTTDKYTVAFELSTNDPKVESSNEYKDAVAKMQQNLQDMIKQGKLKKEYNLTNTEAVIEWGQLEVNYKNSTEIQNLVDALARQLKDTTLSFAIKMKKNGADWKSMEWQTWYHGY